MPKQALSLHIGLNRVDPAHYEGWDGALTACEFDARDMEALALKQGFRPQKPLTAQATAAAVLGALHQAAAQLNSGDIFFLSYSGHGGQVPDANHDEKDPGRQDETWVLYDRQVIDDELWNAWKQFKRGVRIVVLSDSCHSGTVVRALPPTRSARVYKAHRDLYDAIQRRTPAGEKARVRASVLLISGCQDNQFSLDGRRNGLFTEKLRKVWNNGKFAGTYRQFRDRIAALMPPTQTPNYYTVGAAHPAFEAQKPFTI